MCTVQELLATKEANDKKKKKATGLAADIKGKLISKANVVLPIMNKVERDVIASREQELLDHVLYDSRRRPVHARLGNVTSVRTEGKLIRFKVVDSYCGGESVHISKIPIAYFDMSVPEIDEAHTKFANERLDIMIKNNRTQLIKEKTNKINVLKKELKLLESYEK